jgi:hypothetical protein
MGVTDMGSHLSYMEWGLTSNLNRNRSLNPECVVPDKLNNIDKVFISISLSVRYAIGV